MTAIKFILLLCALAIVMPVTLLVWIPLLVRMITVIAFVALASAFTKANLRGVREGLEQAIRLPAVVFRQTIAAVFPPTTPDDQPATLQPEGWKQFLGQCAFAIAFWAVTLVILTQLLPTEANGSSSTHVPSSDGRISALIFDEAAFVEIGVTTRRHLFAKNEAARFRVTPAALRYEPDGYSAALELTFCQITEPAFAISELYAWYTEPGNRRSIHWTFSSQMPLKIRPGECQLLVLKRTDRSSVAAGLFDQRPLGNIHFSLDDRNSFGSLNLSSAEENGYVWMEKLGDPDSKAQNNNVLSE